MRFVPCLGLLALMCCALAAPARARTARLRRCPKLAGTIPPTLVQDAAIQAAQARYAIPPGLLGSIAKVESGRPVATLTDIRPWPWTIDADGTGMFFDTKAEAVAGRNRRRGAACARWIRAACR